ncbi:hypothetical protein G4B88_019169 [Cannabis sativa]|uniref:DUF4283 domain-containing protein n=1 Tax=Cannabis sativa TaxID=3483 RepID=A0A7J6HNR9_CANSA|nr:hypothetical protein G4B88_019169 [Cannabis sativa]
MDPSNLCEVFEDVVQINQDDITFSLNPGEVDEPQEENKVLLGEIFSRYMLGKGAIQGSLKLSWNEIKGWKWKELEGWLLQLTFANRNDAMNELARRPWFVCGALLVIMPWPAWLTPAEVRLIKPLSSYASSVASSPTEDQSKQTTKGGTAKDSPLMSLNPAIFSTGSSPEERPTRRRGRPKRQSIPEQEESHTPKRRGRPPKDHKGLSTTPRTFKWTNTAKSKKSVGTVITSLREGNSFDLKVNLDNHFVVIEKDSIVNKGWDITSDPQGVKWHFQGMYGPPHGRDEEDHWLSIGETITASQIPTLILGDLNGTLMVSCVGVVDLGYHDPPFTWTKSNIQSQQGRLIKEARLDRSLATTDWRILFPSAVVNHLSATVSDHRPILLDTAVGVNCKGRLFKYENMWARDQRCFWVVREAWAKRLHQNSMTNFHRKVKQTCRKLSWWNKTQFKKLSLQVAEAT